MNVQEIQAMIRDIPDFPKPGIVFKDITPLLGDSATFAAAIEKISAALQPYNIDAIVGIESRGFIFGPAVAFHMKKGFIPLRKKGKLPFKTEQVSYELEYGEATLEIHIDSLIRGQRVAIIDDVLATGGTAAAACTLVERIGGHVAACAFLGELGFLDGRSKISGYPSFSLLQF